MVRLGVGDRHGGGGAVGRLGLGAAAGCGNVHSRSAARRRALGATRGDAGAADTGREQPDDRSAERPGLRGAGNAGLGRLVPPSSRTAGSGSSSPASCSAAAATKYLGLLFAAALAVDGLWRLARQKTRRRQLVLGGATLVVLAASTAGVWYVRAAWHRGNPVYPFFSAALGGEELGALPERKTPLLASPTAALTAPWQITMHPERFGGRGHRLGPLLLAVLPGLVACRRLRGLGTLLGVAGVFAVGWLLLRQNVRFLLPALPPLCVACAWCVAEWSRWPRAPRVVACAALATVLGLHTAAAGWRARDKVAVAVGRETREDYLLRSEPTFRAAATANELYRAGDVIFSQDYRGFYFCAPVVREATYRRQTAYDQQAGDRAAVGAHLADAGFTHVLLARRCNSAAGDNVANAAHQGIHFNDTLSRLWDTAPLESERPAALDVAPQLLIDYEVVDSDGALRHYRLVQLPQRK
ncbi:MAG: hypothetical protein R3C10_02455 [Pirellulales bacterium]